MALTNCPPQRPCSYVNNAAGLNGALPDVFVYEYNMALVDLISQGVFEKLESEYIPPAQCGMASTSTAITFAQLEGLWVVLACTCGAALIMYVLPHISKRFDTERLSMSTRISSTFGRLSASFTGSLQGSFTGGSQGNRPARLSTDASKLQGSGGGSGGAADSIRNLRSPSGHSLGGGILKKSEGSSSPLAHLGYVPRITSVSSVALPNMGLQQQPVSLTDDSAVPQVVAEISPHVAKYGGAVMPAAPAAEGIYLPEPSPALLEGDAG